MWGKSNGERDAESGRKRERDSEAEKESGRERERGGGNVDSRRSDIVYPPHKFTIY
jgi:hypothetical protein